MKASDLREKSGDDLRELEKSLAGEVFQNRLKNFTNRLDDTSAIRKTKRELARVTTLLREQQLGLKRGAAGTDKAQAPATTVEAKPKAEAKPKKTAAKKADDAGKSAGSTSSTKKSTAKKSEAKKS
jgi:large subunit ribosomal protein L29